MPAYAQVTVDGARVVNVAVSWIDQPNKSTNKDSREKPDARHDLKSEADLFRALRKTLRTAGIQTGADVPLVIEIEVLGSTLIQQYRDTLFGREANRPAKYSGGYVARVLVDGEQIARRTDEFSFTSSYSAGRTSTKISKVKVIGLIDKWFARFIRQKKFQRALLKIDAS